MAAPKNYELFPHQAEAVEAVVEYLDHHGRCQCIMATGSGKTRVAVEAIERIVGRLPETQQVVLVFFVPTMTLARQLGDTLKEDLRLPRPVRYTAVASDEGVSEGDLTVAELGLKATTDARNLRDLLLGAGRKAGGIDVVVSTYQSADVVAQALRSRRRNDQFVMLTLDEAHRSVAPEFAAALAVSCDMQLSMTGTQAPEMADRRSVYGPVAYELTLAQAEERGITRPIQLVPFPVRLSDLFALTESPSSPYYTLSLEEAATAYMMECMVADPSYEIRAGIGFFNRIAESKAVTGTLAESRQARGKRPIRAFHMDGTMRTAERARVLAEAGESAAGEVHILDNAHVLTEGVNFVAANAAFLHAPRGPRPTSQAIGRVVRYLDDPDRPAIVAKALIIDDSTPAEPKVDPDSLRELTQVATDIRHFHAKVHEAIALPSAVAPSPACRKFAGGRPEKLAYGIWAADALEAAKEAVESVKAAVRPISGRQYWGVVYDEQQGLWWARVRNPAFGREPGAPQFLVHKSFDNPEDAAICVDRDGILAHDLAWPLNFGKNPKNRSTDHVPGVHVRSSGSWDAAVQVEAPHGARLRISRTVRTRAEAMAAVDALRARYGIRAPRLAPEDDLRFDLIQQKRNASKRYPGVEACPVGGWWAVARDRLGRTIDVGSWPAEDIAGAASAVAQEILDREALNQHRKEGVAALSQRLQFTLRAKMRASQPPRTTPQI